MRINDLEVLAAAGWDIGNHTTTHDDGGDLTDEASLLKLRKIYLENQEWIANTFGSRGAYHACYPSGKYSDPLIDILQSIGTLTGRKTSGVWPAMTSFADYYELPVMPLSSAPDWDDVYTVKKAITQAVNSGTSLIIMMHRVATPFELREVTEADLQEVVSFAKRYTDLGRLTVMTVSDWYDWQMANHPLDPVAPPAVNVSVDDAYDTVTGLNPLMEYSLDGAPYRLYDATAFNALDFSGDHTLLVRYAASIKYTVGPASAFYFTTGAPPVPAAKILFTFDGGWKSQLEHALPILNAAGFTATTYVMRDFVITESLTNPELLNPADITELMNNGWDIGNHTTNHDDRGDQTSATVLNELREAYLQNQAWISELGSPGAYHAAYPSGLYSQDLINILKDIGTLTARTTNVANQETPITDPNLFYLLPCQCFSSDPNYVDAATIMEAIDRAVINGSTVIIFMNSVGLTYADGNVTTADLQTVVDHAKAYADQGKIRAMTISEWYAAQTQTPLPLAPSLTVDDTADKVVGTMTEAMEYSLDGEPYARYDAAVFAALDFSGNHTLLVRYAATDSTPAGLVTTLLFTSADPVTPPAPPVTNDDLANTVSGMTTAMEYSLDSAPYVRYDATTFAALEFAGDHVLQVRYAASGINPYGPDTTLIFTLDPVTPPAPPVTNDDLANTVSGMTTAMEYSLDGAPYVRYDATTFAALDFAGDHVLLVRYAASGINPCGPDTALIFTMNPVTVTFDRNGGDTDASPASVTVNYNTTVILPAILPTRSGYVFVEWNLTPDGNGLSFTAATPVTADVTAYAIWLQHAGAGLTATATGIASINLSWLAAEGADGYEVSRSTRVKNGYRAIATTENLSYLDTGLNVGITYYYRIRAYRMIGSSRFYSNYSAIVSAVPTLPPLTAPVNFVVTRVTSTSIRLTWDPVTEASGYEVYRSTSATGSFKRILTTSQISFLNTGLSANRNYYYMVRAYRIVGSKRVYSPFTDAQSPLTETVPTSQSEDPAGTFEQLIQAWFEPFLSIYLAIMAW